MTQSRFLSLGALAVLTTTAAPSMAAVRTRFVDDADPNLAGFPKTDVSKTSISNGALIDGGGGGVMAKSAKKVEFGGNGKAVSGSIDVTTTGGLGGGGVSIATRTMAGKYSHSCVGAASEIAAN